MPKRIVVAAVVATALIAGAGGAYALTKKGGAPAGTSTITAGPSTRTGPAPLLVDFIGAYEDDLGVGIPNATIFVLNESPSGAVTELTTGMTNPAGAFTVPYTFSQGTYNILIADNAQGS